MVNLQMAMAVDGVPRATEGLLRCSRCWLALRSGLLEAIDRLEAAVGLDHGQKHLIRATVVGGAVAELEATEIHGAGFLRGLDQALPRGIAADLFERRDDGAADQVTLQRDEAGLRIRRGRLERGVIAPDDR